MKIAVIGLGFVGLTLSSVLASKGIRTVGIDLDKEKCSKIAKGEPTFFEPNLKKTLKKALKKNLLITDKLSSINYNYYEKNQQLGWHFDNASFAITLMIENADSGGIFEYINKGRDYEKNYLNKNLIQDVLSGRYPVKKIAVKPGTLLLFYGRNYLHRVTPVTSY